MPETPEKTNAVTASPKSSPSKKEIDAATMAVNHFAQGKRHLVVGDIPSAVNALQEACKLLADQYGETAPECGDAYFCYGKALLEMARIESGVIGNALDGEEGSTENEEDESEADADSQEEGSQDGDAAENDAADGEAAEGEAEGEKAEGEENKEGEGDQTEEDEEDVTNLQLAWEMLELAKVIFQKQEDSNPKMKKKVAEVYLKLGEVGLESENYAQGIEDFKQCLAIQKKELNDDDRCLAETFYQLGTAHSFGDEFDNAIECFGSAVNVLETRITNLNEMKKEKLGWTEEQRVQDAASRVDPFYTEQGEIDELNQLLPEMKEKIVDMKEMKKDSMERLKAAKAMLVGVMGGGEPSDASSSSSAFGAPSSNPFGAPSTSSSSASTIAAKPIMAIRKKRKLENDDAGEESKKVKGSSGESVATSNGSKMSNGQTETSSTNGKQESMETTSGDKKKVELQTAS